MILYNNYLREKYGCKVYRVAIDAGFACPDRCTYCNTNGSRASYINPKESIKEQLRERIDFLKEFKSAKKFIAYFQAFTNTNAPVDELKKMYDNILDFKDIVGMSIGTRPDMIDREKLKLIASYKDSYEVWLEYGIQSIHDKTLKLIKRGHTFDDSLNAVKMTRQFDIPICAHVILGLPGETKYDMLATAGRLAELKVEGIKIHPLHILKGSELERPYREGRLKLLEEDEYVDIVREFLKILPQNIVVMRLTGQGSREEHVAPKWALDKAGTINKIKNVIARRP